MITPLRVDAIIPALNEAESLGRVLDLLPSPPVRRVIVADNGSTDSTSRIARDHGATTVLEPRRGYGAACLKGIEALAHDPPDVVLFLDADLSDDPTEAGALLGPILEGRADLVVGSRTSGARERWALTPHARFGNWIATRLLKVLYGARYTDLGPFRAIRYESLRKLGMADRDFGWTIEMQVKAARMGLRHVEVPVRYRRRLGRSKISGTVGGSLRAGLKILGTIVADYVSHGPPVSGASGQPGGTSRRGTPS